MASLGSLVIELAANTARLQSDMGKAVNIVQGASNKIASLFRTFGIAAGGAGLAAVARQSIALGDNLNKAAIKAGISGKAMSELAHAAKMSDVDLASLSTSLKKMQVNLSEVATGAKGPTTALAALGLTLRDLQGLSADRQFELIGDRISKLKDPADRARAATELFGKAGADLLPLFEQGAQGIRAAREEAQKLGVSFSGDQIKALAEADDAIKRLQSTWEAFATSMTAKVAPSLSYFLEEITSKINGKDIDRVRVLAEEIRVLQDSISKGGGGILTPFISLGAAGGAPDVAAGIYSLDDQIKKLDELKQKLNRLNRTNNGTGRGGTGAAPVPGFAAAAANEAIEGISDVVVNGKRLNAEFYADLEQMTRTSAEQEVRAYDAKVAAIKQLLVNRTIDEEEAAKRMAEIENEFNRDSLADVVVTAKRIKDTTQDISEFAKQAARNMQDTLADFLFDPFQDGLKGMLRGFVDTIRRMIAEAAAADVFGAITGKGGGNLSAIFKGVGKLFGGFRAAGGPVSGGTSYMVGERGPELFTPSSGGSITPNNRLGGGLVVAPVYNIDARGNADLAKQLPAIFDRNNKALTADIINGIRRGKYAV